LVLARSEQQRQRRRPFSQVGADDLSGVERVTRAVEDVVRDLEGDPEREAEIGERRRRLRAAAEQTGGLEELSRLQRAPLEVPLDRRFRIVRLRALERLPARERQAGTREGADRGRLARRGQLG